MEFIIKIYKFHSRRKEEEKKKRQQTIAQPFAPIAGAPGGRNFVIPEKKDRGDKFGNIVQAKQVI